MAEIAVLDDQGKKIKTVQVAESFMSVDVSTQVLTDVVVGLRANQRRGTAKTKNKSEVNFSGAKPWRQKGTGRARSGERSSPIWRKGAVVFGPRPRSYRKTLPLKVKREALHVALADKIASGQVVLVDKIALEQPKTKLLVGLLDKWKVAGNAMIVLEKADKNIALAARNIPNVDVHNASTVTTYEVLRYKHLVTTPEGLDRLKSRTVHHEK